MVNVSLGPAPERPDQPRGERLSALYGYVGLDGSLRMWCRRYNLPDKMGKLKEIKYNGFVQLAYCTSLYKNWCGLKSVSPFGSGRGSVSGWKNHMDRSARRWRCERDLHWISHKSDVNDNFYVPWRIIIETYRIYFSSTNIIPILLSSPLSLTIHHIKYQINRKCNTCQPAKETNNTCSCADCWWCPCGRQGALPIRGFGD